MTAAIPVGGRCAFLRAKLAQRVADLRQAATVEKFATGVKAGYLASPKTFMRNLIGNGATLGVESFVIQPTAAVLDYFAAVGKSAMTRFSVPASEFRSLNAPSIAGLKFGARGFREGLAKAVQIVKTGVDQDVVNAKFDFERVSFDTPALNKAIHTVFDVMEASDRPWYAFSFNTSLFNTAEVLAIKEGLKGSARTARVNELLAAPTDEMTMRAMEDAQYATFKNRTVLGDAAAGVKQRMKNAGTSAAEIQRNPATAKAKRITGKAAYAASELVLPFTSVPTAIAGVALDYSPLGFVKALALAFPKETSGGGRTMVRLARAGAGTAATFGIGYALAKQGLMTGSSPSTPAERAEWEAEGKPSNSVKFKGRWYSLNGAAPMTLPAILGANLYQASVAHPDMDPVSKAGQSVAFEAKSLTEQTFLQGLQAMLDAIEDPARSGPKFVSSLIPVPPIVGSVAAGVDPTVRESKTVADKVTARIPLASQTLEPRLDQFGRTTERNSGGLLGMMKEVFDFTSSRPDKSDDVTRELDRLRVYPGLPSKTVRVQKQPITMSPREYGLMMRALGPATHQALAEMFKDPDYQSMSDEDRATAIKATINAMRQDAHNQYKGDVISKPGWSPGKPVARK